MMECCGCNHPIESTHPFWCETCLPLVNATWLARDGFETGGN